MELRAAVHQIPPSSNAHAHVVWPFRLLRVRIFVITLERTPGLHSRITLDPVMFGDCITMISYDYFSVTLLPQNMT